MKPTFVLIHSPLQGPATLAPTRKALEKRGYAVKLPALTPAFAGAGPYYTRVGQAIGAETTNAGDGVVFVAHGPGGTLTSAAGAASQSPVLGVIFIEATFPHPGRRWFDTVPIELEDRFKALAKNGRIPTAFKFTADQESAWKRNLGDSVYKTLAAEQTELPLEFFNEKAPPNDALRNVQIGYIQLRPGDANHDDAVWMRWRTKQLDCKGSFPTMTDADKVAEAIEALSKELVP